MGRGIGSRGRRGGGRLHFVSIHTFTPLDYTNIATFSTIPGVCIDALIWGDFRRISVGLTMSIQVNADEMKTINNMKADEAT